MGLTFRDEKGAPLTHEELDENFRSFFYTASFAENQLILQRKDGTTATVPIGGEAFADFQENGGSIGDVYIADSQITGSRMIIDLFNGQFYDKNKAMNSDGGNLSSDEWYIDFDPAVTAPYYVHFGSNFAISSSGFLHASGAIIEGDITASSGLIGGFSITPNAIHGPETLGIPSFFISGAAGPTDHFISASNFNLKGNGDITGSAVMFSGGKIAGWEITNTQIKKSTNVVIDANAGSITFNDSTFGNKGIQLEYNEGTPRFYVGDATSSFVKFDGSNVSLSTSLLEISASNIEISSTEASMSLGNGSVKLLGASSAIEVGETNVFKISGSALDAMIVAGAKTGFGTDAAGVIIGMDNTVPTLDLTKDANNYVRFNTTTGVDIKTDNFKLDTTYFNIDTTTQRLNIFDTASAEIIRLGEISDAADDLYGIKIYNGAGTGSANTIAMFGQQGNKIGGWEITDSQIRTIPTAGFGENYGEDETGLIIHSDGKLESSNFVSNLKGWRIDTIGNGSAEFENMRIRGTLSTTVFEKETVNVVGGQLMVANATTIQPLKDTDGVILAGSSSYAANAVTFSVANTSGFSEGEILKIKSVNDAGFSVEYVYVSGSKRYSEDSSITGNTGSIDPDGLAGELYVERAYGGTPAVSASITTLSADISTTGETSVNVTDSSGLGVQNIIKIGNERLKVTAISSNVLTVIRDYHDTEADSHVNGDTVYLIDLDAEFLSGLVSTAKPYNEGQVLVSTGVFNPSQDISSGYIMMNANPRDVSTPYMDIVERTGSGAYDLQLRSRLGDLSGLASGYLYGNNEPGFGLYTENGFFKGAITAETGSIAGILHVATVAGGLETGQKISIGRKVSGTTGAFNDGIFVNNNNYWYTDGAWKVGGANNFISLDNFTDGNLVINTETFTLDTSTFIISSSLNNGTLAAGTNAGNMTSTTGTGVYLDGNGKFRVGTGTTGANYIYWDGTTLNIKGNIDITGGSGVNTEELNAATSSLSGSLGTEISASDAAFSASVENTTSTLDGKIFTDSAGRAVRPPTASAEGLYLASTNLGFYKDGEWKTYMDNQGDFFLTGSEGNKLAWDSSTGTLEIAGAINITSGNAATQDYATNAASASAAVAESASLAIISQVSASLSGSISSSTATLQSGLESANLVLAGKSAIFRQAEAPYTASGTIGDMWIDSDEGNAVKIWSGDETGWATTPDETYNQLSEISGAIDNVSLDIFTDSSGRIVRTPDTASAGLYLGDEALGFYSESEWKTYMANNGNFYLTGSDQGESLTWDGGTLKISGEINVTAGNVATTSSLEAAQTAAELFASASAAAAADSGIAAADAAYSASLSASENYTDQQTDSLDTALSASISASNAAFANQAVTNASLSLVQEGLNSIFRQDNAPATESRLDGDMWIDSNDGNAIHIYSASEWVAASDTTYDQSQLITDSVGTASLNTFTDSTGRIVRPTDPNLEGLYTGPTAMGYYSGSAFQTFMANNGNFFLTGSETNYLKWDGGALVISGEVNILGGNAATQDYVTGSVDDASTALTEAQESASAESNASASLAIAAAQGASQAALQAALSASAALSRSVDVDGKIAYNPTPPGDGYGLYYNADRLGFYNSGSWKTYMSGSGEFFLTGSNNSGLAWTNDELTVDGTIIARAGEIGGITLEDSKLYNGEGTHSDADTGFYLDSSSNFSLGDKLVWNASTQALTISGEINVTNPGDFASQAELEAEQSSSADLFLAAFASASAANDAATSASLEASSSSSAAQTAAEASATAALNTATGSLQTYADTAVTAITGSILTAQSTADAATGSIATLIAATSSMVNPATYNFGPDAQMSLASLPTPPETAGLYTSFDAFGFHDGTQFLTFMSSSGLFMLSGSGDDGLVWNGQSLSIGNPGVGPSFEYNFSGSLDTNLFDSSITTTTSYASPVFGNEFNNNNNSWDEGFHTKALFDRKDGGIFEWDIVTSDYNPRTMIGLFEEGANTFSYGNLSHAIYFYNGNIYAYEDAKPRGALAYSAWTTNTPTLFRISIQLKPTGAVYKIFKDGDFTSPYVTYDSQVVTNPQTGNNDAITERYVRPGAAIHNSGTTNNLLFSRMSGGKTLGMSTRISGNGIQTGGIQSTNWGTANGSRLDLDAGTFKLGGSAAPSLSWDGTTLNVKGNIEVTNPDTFATPSTKNKSDYNIILVSTGSAGTTASGTLTYISESLGYTGGNESTWYYDDNGYASNNTNPADIDGFDSHDYDLYVFDERNWGLNGSEIQLALNLFDLGKSVLVVGNDTNVGNYTGSYNTEWPIAATANGTGIGWMMGYSAANQGLPASHPILAGISANANVGINTSSDSGRLITQLKKSPGGGTIVHPFSLKGSSTTLTLSNDVYTSNSGGGVVSFIATNPRGGRLVSANMYGIQAPTNGATFSNYGGVIPSASLNLTNFLLRTDPAIEAHYMQVTSITGEMVTTGKIESTNYNYTSGTYSAAGTQFNLDTGDLISEEFSIIDGNANFSGTVSIGNTDLTAANTLNSSNTADTIGLGNVDNITTATMRATAAATDGTIAGWNISSYNINSGNTANTTQNQSGYTAANGGIVMNYQGSIHSPNFYINKDGTAAFRGSLQVGNTTLSEANTLNENVVTSELFYFTGSQGIAPNTPTNDILEYDFESDKEGTAKLKLVIADAEAAGIFTGAETLATQVIEHGNGWFKGRPSTSTSYPTLTLDQEDKKEGTRATRIQTTVEGQYVASNGITSNTERESFLISGWFKGTGTMKMRGQRLGNDYRVFADKAITLTDVWTYHEIAAPKGDDTLPVRMVLSENSGRFDAYVFEPSIKREPNYSGVQATVNGRQLRTRLSRTDVGGADNTLNTYFDNIKVNQGSNTIKIFSTSTDGATLREIEVTYTATEDITSGSAGGWTIDQDAIFSGTKTVTNGFAESGLTLHSAGSIHAKEFFINNEGSASFKGIVTAAGVTGSLIRGTNIEGGVITGGTLEGGSLSIPTQELPLFSVSAEGYMTASDASISGEITATSGRIGDWVIDESTNALRDEDGEIVFEPNIPEIQMYVGADKKVIISPLGDLTSTAGGAVNVNIDAIGSTGNYWSSFASTGSIPFLFSTDNTAFRAKQYFGVASGSILGPKDADTFNATSAGDYTVTLNIPAFTAKVGTHTTPTVSVADPNYVPSTSSQKHGFIRPTAAVTITELYLCAFNSGNDEIGSTLLGSSTAIGRTSSFTYKISSGTNSSNTPEQFEFDFTSVDSNALVTLIDGSTKLAKNINRQDKLKVWDEETSKFIGVTPAGINTRTVNEHWLVEAGGKNIRVTYNHNFWTDGGHIIPTEKIDTGITQIYIDTGNGVELKTVDKRELVKEELEVHSYEIPDKFNYIANSIIHHNPSYGYTWVDATFAGSSASTTSNSAVTNAEKIINVSEAGTIHFRYKWKVITGSGRSVTVSNSNSVTYTERKHTVGANQAATFTSVTGFDTQLGLAVPSNFVELKAGGLQIVSDADKYVRAERLDSNATAASVILQTKGGTLATDAIRPNTTSTSTTTGFDIGSTTYRYKDIYAYRIAAANNITAFTTGNASDKRLKHNVKPLKGALDKVLKLQGVSFDWNNKDLGSSIGFIAQDFEKHIPELVSSSEIITEEYKDTKTIDYAATVAVLTEAIKELSAKVIELEKKLETKN